MIEVFVESIRVNMTSYKRVVMLKEKTAQRYLPVWIGHFEADAIAIPMQNVPVNRPLTHDLLTQTIRQLGGTCTWASITRLENETFYATLVVDQAGRHVELDCRPSDAISVAIRAKVPIYVDDAVMEQAAMTFDATTAGEGSDDTSEEGPAEGAVERAGRAVSRRRAVPSEARDAADIVPYELGAEPAGGRPPEPFEQLGPVTRPVLAALEWAIGDARRARRWAIGPGDLALGLLRERRAASNRVLTGLSIDVDELRQIVEEQIDRDHPSAALTPAAEAVVRRAIEEAARVGERSIASHHVLVALAGDAEGSVAIALDKLAISQSALRRQIAVLLSPPPGDEPS